MRKSIFTLTATIAILSIGSLPWRAEAAPWQAASQLRIATDTLRRYIDRPFAACNAWKRTSTSAVAMSAKRQ
jgi:hypothetical protein